MAPETSESIATLWAEILDMTGEVEEKETDMNNITYVLSGVGVSKSSISKYQYTASSM